MLTKILALSLIAGGTLALTSYSRLSNFQIDDLEFPTITQLLPTDVEEIASYITVRVHAGDDRGSGVLIAKDNNTYTLITNAHVASRGETHAVETADGVRHEATLITSNNNEQVDLAILQFSSDNNYQLATIGNSDSIDEGEQAIAAGFPDGESELLVTEGEISLITQKPLNKGYSIGFTNETLQGMSGGALLNSSGEVIGILGKGKGAILATAYNYSDGTTPTPEEIAAFKDASFSIPIANIAQLDPKLATLLPDNNSLAQQPKVTDTPSQTEYTGIVGTVDNIAEQITVRIATPKLDSHGSGVIIARNDNTYYVATAGHVVNPDGEYRIITPDGDYELNNQTISKSSAYDLAIFSFTSEKDYTVATIGNYIVGAIRPQVVFVSGFPNLTSDPAPTTGARERASLEENTPQRKLTGGKVVVKDEIEVSTKDSYSIGSNGQGLLYSNISYGGMSGGAVLDSEGKLVGINTGAENELYFDQTGDTDELSLGFSLGESIQNMLGFLTTETELKTAWLQKTNEPAAKVNDRDYSSIEAQLLNVEQPEDDTDLVAWMNYGNGLWRYEKFDEAIAAFEKVAAIDPQFDRAYYGMGLAHWYRGDYQNVIEVLNKAIEINPSPYYYWRHLGFSHGQLQQWSDALAAFEEAITKNPEDFVLYLQRGDVLRESGSKQAAIESYNEASQINPQHPWIYNNRGFAYAEIEQYDKAILDLTKALELNPQLFLTYNNRGAVYQEIERYDAALADLDKAIALNPNYADAYNNRGGTYIDLKQYDKASTDLNKAIELDPELAKAYYGRGTLHAELQEFDKAIADYSKSIEINPDFPYVYYNRGTTYHGLQQYDNTIADLSKAIELKPDYADAYYNRGTTYNELEQYDLGLSDLTKAIELDPQYLNAYINRGTTYRALEQYEAAIEDWTQAIALDPQNADAYFKRGGLYKDLKQTDKAIADLVQTTKLDPQNAQAYVGLGLIYYELQDIPKTRENWEQAAALFEEQGQTELYQNLQGLLQEL